MSDAINPPFPNRADSQRQGRTANSAVPSSADRGRTDADSPRLYQLLEDRPESLCSGAGAAEEWPTPAGPKGRARCALRAMAPPTDTDIISAQHFWTGGLETAGPGCYDAVAIARTAGFRMSIAGIQKNRCRTDPEKSLSDNRS